MKKKISNRNHHIYPNGFYGNCNGNHEHIGRFLAGLCSDGDMSHAFIYCPASNSFFLPSMPDMASTFFLQSVTSSFCSNREMAKTRFSETEIVARACLITADCGITPQTDRSSLNATISPSLGLQRNRNNPSIHTEVRGRQVTP